jgi:hypothetical protein
VIKRIPFLFGLFLLCMCTLMLQVIQTRILSVVSMYFLAFLSISMAMLGMTAGALLVYFKLGKITRKRRELPLKGLRRFRACNRSLLPAADRFSDPAGEDRHSACALVKSAHFACDAIYVRGRRGVSSSDKN